MRQRDYPYRRATRSRQHDYDRPGTYFVTTCTVDREPLFGEITDGAMNLNRLGQLVEWCWRQIPLRFGPVSLDACVVMPNHLHGIVVLSDSAGSTPSLSTVIGAFKADSSRRINNIRGSRGVPIWQRSFHDQIIRDERHLENVRTYIHTNPANWPDDKDNPSIQLRDIK